MRVDGSGFTLLEILVVMAVMVIILTLAAPSFQQLIAQERLKSVTAELVTSLQNSRTEAVAGGGSYQVNVGFNPSGTTGMTCYTVYTTNGLANCKCYKTPGNACTAGVELHTVQIPASTGVQVRPVSSGTLKFGSDGLQSGASPTTPDFVVDTKMISGAKGWLRTTVNAMGRPSVCSPDQSVSGVPAC